MAEIEHLGVFVEEIPRGPQPIEGVATSVAAFVGRTWRGPIDEPVHLKSFADYERQFGGLWRDSAVGFAVRQFFDNGGADAIVVRVATRTGPSAAASAIIPLKEGAIFRAANPGSWGFNLKVAIDRAGLTDDTLFNLTVTDDAASRRDSDKRGGSGFVEQFAKASVDPASAQFVGSVLQQQSQLLRYEAGLRAIAPGEQTATALDGSGSDGTVIGTAEVTAPGNRAAETGLYALGKGDPFNLLCVPPYAHGVDLDVTKDWAPAAQYCRERRALLIVDAPSAWTIESAEPNVQAFHAIARENAALYFPRVLAPNPLDDGKPASYAPCGMVAGVMARTDASRGVWKAPAGVEAGLSGVGGLIANGEPAILTDSADGRLNGVGINCLRRFPSVGFVVWGARTLAGADVEASQWKYVNVRRLSLYIEESIDRGTQWVVFEPNSEPTWSAVVRSVQTFLAGLWREGAFAGNTQSDSFFVTCDRTTMTQDDIQNGRLIAIVGVAPIKPAEFVIIQIGQRTAEAMR